MIAYDVVGDGPPLVLVHGGVSNHREWRAQLEGLSDTFTVVAWDAPGCGASSDPPAWFRMPDYAARLEEPAKTTYRGYTVYKHSFTSQGPVLLQALNILENFDLRAMRHDSADYIHTIIEALKLAYADRDTYYADTAFVQVPGEGLLSKDYAKERAALIDAKIASKAFIAGDPLKYDSKVKSWPYARFNIPDGTRITTATQGRSLGLDSAGVSKDTTHMAVIDKDGNIFDVTPSGGWIPGAVILGDTGIGMSVRGEQF